MQQRRPSKQSKRATAANLVSIVLWTASEVHSFRIRALRGGAGRRRTRDILHCRRNYTEQNAIIDSLMTENALNGHEGGARGAGARPPAQCARGSGLRPPPLRSPLTEIPSAVQMLVFLWRSYYYDCWWWVWSRRQPTVRSWCVVVSTWSVAVFTAAGACAVLVCFAGQPPNLRSLRIRTYLVRQVSLGCRPGDDASGSGGGR